MGEKLAVRQRRKPMKVKNESLKKESLKKKSQKKPEPKRRPKALAKAFDVQAKKNSPKNSKLKKNTQPTWRTLRSRRKTIMETIRLQRIRLQRCRSFRLA